MNKQTNSKQTKIGEVSEVLLQDYCDAVQYGYTQSASDENIGPKFLRITDIQRKPINWGKVPYCKISEKDHSKYVLEDGDIVIARTGASTGTNAIYESDKMPESVFASYLIRIKLNKNFVPKYVYYFLQSPYYTEYITGILSGSAQPNANAKQLTDVSLKQFDLLTQRQIVSILSSLDDKIELNHKMNQTLEEIGKTLFRQWFVDFEFPNKEGKPHKSSGGEMVDSELGKIPEGWEVGKLKDLIEITSGKRPKVKVDDKTEGHSMPIIGASGVMGYTSDILYDERIIVTGRVGTLGIVQKINYPCWISDNALVVKSEYYEYIYEILSSLDFSSLNVGSTQPLITQAALKDIDILIPQKSILLRFEESISCLTLKVKENNIENKLLKGIRDSLLPRLMSGRIRVN